MSLAFACVYLQDRCSFWDQITTRELGSSMMRKLEIGVSRNMNLSGIDTIILGAMYVGAMAMAVFLILVQCTSREDLPCTFPPLLRVELGVLGLSWDFWAKSVSELQLEVEQIRLDAIEGGCFDRWRVCRWPDSTEQAVTWLMGIFILLCLRGRRWRRRNEMRFSPLARGCSSSTSRWEGTIWDKNPALPGVGSSFGAKLKQNSHPVEIVSKRRRTGVQLCCDHKGKNYKYWGET